jgi:hypothetical protein
MKDISSTTRSLMTPAPTPAPAPAPSPEETSHMKSCRIKSYFIFYRHVRLRQGLSSGFHERHLIDDTVIDDASTNTSTSTIAGGNKSYEKLPD